jgi:tRNA G18 (ribose-2'-O)-methylase SpoU
MSETDSHVLVLENIRSLHNVGAMFRTADGAGFSKIFCCGYTPDPTDERMAKVALGAEKQIAWQRFETAIDCCRKLKELGYTILALETGESAVGLFDFNTEPNQKIALVVGHEVNGIDEATLQAADHILEIPMAGVKESLNVSVAAGIAMYRLRF